MKPARLIVLAIALVAGGIAAWLASGSRAPEPPKPAPAPPPLATVEVLVAKSDLGVGQVVG
jgi:pilus assembly protein CpaB